MGAPKAAPKNHEFFEIKCGASSWIPMSRGDAGKRYVTSELQTRTIAVRRRVRSNQRLPSGARFAIYSPLGL